MLTDPAARLAALEDAALLSLHKRLDDTSTVDDPAAVEAHHLVTTEMLKRGIDHGHESDDWSRAVVLVDEAVVKSLDEIDLPEGMAEPFEAALIDGGTVTVLLTADGYVMKAQPGVGDVHVDAIMGAYPIRRKRRRKGEPEAEVQKANKWEVDDFVSWNSSGGRARGRIERIVEEGSIDVPDSSFTINAEPDDPAVLIRVYRLTSQGFRPTDTLVGHKASTLRSIGPLEKAEGYEVPEDVRAAAKRALGWISDGRAGDGFTSVGRNRARQLADGGPVGRDTLVKMRAYFARHGAQRGNHAALKDGEPTPWRVAWDAWGGDAGRTWANRVLAAMDKAYDPEAALTAKEKALYDAYEMVAEQYGEFTPAEAHYMGADDNPFQAEGMNCANCVFYDGGGGCEILTEQVEAMGLCKLWIIPGDLLAVDEEELLQTMDDDDLAEFGRYAAEMDDDDDEMEKRGNPEPLRDYWRAGGKGKINWGAGGDFTACVAAVSKYMTSEEAKGYCAIRHREVTGMWPGDKRNRTKKSVDPHTIVLDTVPGPTSTFTLPDGSTYTFSVPVEKHGSHNQQSHAGGRGGAKEMSGGSKGGAESSGAGESYGGYTLKPVDNPGASGRPADVVAAAKAVRARAAESEPQITRDMIDVANANGGTMEGLDFRMKAESSLARKIDDEKAELGGDVQATASKMSDVVRYTMTFDDGNYVDGTAKTIADLEAQGYQMRVKNYWREGDPYQGINVAAVHPSGQKFELQFHTPGSVRAKEPIHKEYETYRTARDNRTRWKTYARMTRMASKIAVPTGAVLAIGTPLFQGFQTAAEAGLV